MVSSVVLIVFVLLAQGSMHMLLFFAFFVSVAVGGSSASVFTSTDNTTCSQFAFSASFLPDAAFRNPQYRICWTITANTTIEMIVQARTNGWVAWGIGNQNGGGMSGNADIYMGFYNSSNQMEALDMWSNENLSPPRDAVQNVLPGYTGYRAQGTTALRFRRLINTGDAANDRIITLGILEIIVAMGSDDNTNAKHRDAAIGYVDMFTGAGSPPGSATSSTQRIDPLQYQFSASLLGDCKLWWKLINGNVSISAALECNTNGWIAFGFSNQAGGGMTNSDMVIGRVVGTAMQVQDYWAAVQSTPTLDTTQSLTNTSGSRVNGTTSMWFTRRLDTGDSRDFRIVPGLIECIVATHASSDLLYYHNRLRAMVYIDFFSGRAPTPAPPAAIDSTWNASQYPNRFNAVPGEFEIYWAVDPNRQFVDFAVRVLGFWASLGPARSTAGNMIASDPMMAYFDSTSGAPIIEDQYSVSLSAPVADTNRGGVASFSQMGGSRNATGMTIKWRRAFVTGDAANDNPLSTTGDTTFVLAWGQSAQPGYHGSQRAAVAVNLLSGGATITTSSDPLKIAHGALMVVAFSLAMSVGMIIALVVPKDKTWWFPAHWILQAFATVLVFVSFFIILAWYSQASRSHFDTSSVTKGSHAILGIIVIALVLWQALLGVVADRVWQSEHKKTGQIPATKWLPDKAHWWLGRFVLVAGCVNIFLGIAEIGYGWPFYVGWGIICLALAVLFAIGFVYYFKTTKQKGHFGVPLGVYVAVDTRY